MIGETFHGQNIGDVTLKGVWLRDDVMFPGAAPLYFHLMMEVESPYKLWDSTLEQWMSILVMAKDNIYWEEAQFVIRERQDPASEGDNYRCEVHYMVPVPKNINQFEIVLSMGGDNYTGVLVFEE